MFVRPRLAVLALLVGLALAACSGSPGGSGAPGCDGAPEMSAGCTAAPSVEPTALTVGLGFIPSVQFAPFYLADQELSLIHN